MTSLRYGHSLQFGISLTPRHDSADAVVALAQRSERLGYDLVTFQDHPYQPRFLDTWTLLTWVASRTQRIRVAGNVLNVPMRPPAVLARAAVSPTDTTSTLHGPSAHWVELLGQLAVQDGIDTFLLFSDDPRTLEQFAEGVIPGCGRSPGSADPRQTSAPVVRRANQTIAAAQSITTAAITEVIPTPLPNACCADASNSVACGAGNDDATAVAPPKVSVAEAAAVTFKPAGSTTWALYVAVRMPPRTAVPSTAPSSYAVSEIADAAPALSAGTLERITSLEIVSAAPTPSDSSTNASSSASVEPCCAPNTTAP